MPVKIQTLKAQTGPLTGQGLVEYSMIGLLVLIVAMPAISLFGGDFLEVLRGIFSNMNQNVTAQATPLTTAQIAQTGDQKADALGGAQSAKVQITLKDGTVIQLSQYPQDLKKYVEVSGTNGTTAILLAQLDSLISQIKKTKTLNQTQVGSLQKLSTQGYRIAAVEKTIENAFKNAKSVNELSNTMITFDGQQYTITDFSWLIGWHGAVGYQSTPPDITNALDNSSTATGPELSRFLDLYFEAEANGSLNDPALKTVVSELSSQIAFLSEVMEDSSWQVLTSTKDLSTLDSLQISSTTHYNSSQICQLNNPNSLIQCQKDIP